VVKPHLGINTSRKDPTLYANDGNINSTIVMLLGVSGGCDSVALFHSVLELTRLEEQTNTTNTMSSSNMHAIRYLHLDSEDIAPYNFTTSNDLFRIPCELHVAHFNHEQRGNNSDADEALVRNLCSEAGIPFHCYSWSEIKSGSLLETTTFSQDVARKWRRKKMIELLETLVTNPNKVNDDASPRWGAILTAHHRDDAEETMLLKLLRGAHLTNLSGMERRSDGFELASAQKVSRSIGYFAKPLLGVRKQDIVDYLTSNNLEWREDESNSENKYKRNKVRNQLIPLLSEIAGGEDALHVSPSMPLLLRVLFSFFSSS
jgi:tRNA(Ile)-lysidine synthetase-like protein